VGDFSRATHPSVKTRHYHQAGLAAPAAPARNALIAAHPNRLEAGLAQTRAAAGSLRRLLAPAAGPAAVEHRSVPATAAAASTAAGSPSDAARSPCEIRPRI
jgi:hypothetical protein